MDCSLETVALINHLLSDVAFCQSVGHGNRTEIRTAEPGRAGRAAALVFVGVGDLKSGLPVCMADTY